MKLKYPVYKNCVHLRKFIVLSAVAVLVVSLLRYQNAKIVLGAWRKNGREDRERKCSRNAVKSVSRMMSTRESNNT